MNQGPGQHTRTKEIIFQVILHIVVFIFATYDRHHPEISQSEIVFFLSYALAAFVINYVLLPRFLYKNQYLAFFISVSLIVGGIIVLEEFVLEQIYYPDSRGKYFMGVFFVLLDILPVITILCGFKFAWDAMIKQQEVNHLTTAVKESEMQFLKSQINPHFLFNNLNNLYSYAIEKSPKTPEIILELSGVLRYMLYECKEAYVPLDKEIGQLQNFMNLNEMQIEERGKISFTPKNIETGYQIAPLILIVFIENAFKHSTASQTDNIIIDVRLKLQQNGTLLFFCENSFRPRSNTQDLSHGIGLENVKKRLELLYPDAHDLKITEQDNFYRVKLEMDLQKVG